LLERLVAPEFEPFTIALVVLGGLIVIELVSMMVGHSASSILDGIIGNDPEGAVESYWGGGLDWLNRGRVPVLVLLMLLLTWFAVAGFALQGGLHAVLAPLPPWIASLVALAAALPLTRGTSRALARIIPADETYVVTTASLVGRTGTITLGPAKRGVVARMKLRDDHGNWHFPSVEPFVEDAEIAEGTLVLVVDVQGSTLRVSPADGILAEPEKTGL
jgi:membrane protein implicated in regulation of membrane protease activity